MTEPGAKFRAVLRWSGMIDEVCSMTGEDRWRFAALGFRESGWGDFLIPRGDPCGRGDDPDGPNGPIPGYGCGLFQIDRRYHKAFVESADFPDPRKQALYACQILHDAREWFRASTLLSVQDPDRMERMTYAAYNCGPANVRKAIVQGRIVDGEMSHDLDAYTTGNDYSHWVWRVAAEIKATVPNLFNPPESHEQRYPPMPKESA